MIMKHFLTKLSRLIWHPFLFLVYAVLSLLVVNLGRIPAAHILRPLLVLCLLTLLLMSVARWPVKDWQRAGIITTLFWLLFFSYGHMYDLLEGTTLLGLDIGRHRVLLPLFTLLLLGGIILIIKIRSSLSQWTVWLNLTTLLLVLIQISLLAVAGYKSLVLNTRVHGGGESVSNEPIAFQVDTTRTHPDIYYIILDTYTRQDAFKSELDFDNSNFLNELRARGFYIADCSQSNYTSTSASLLSSLDLLYLDELKPPLQKGYRNLSFLDPYLQNNRVSAAIESAGYTTVAFESGYSPTELLNAQVYLSRDPGLVGFLIGGLTRYESLLLQSSAGILVFDFKEKLPPVFRYFLDAPYVAHRQRILFELNTLGDIENVKTPKFVFAHILAPHTPFVFTRDGQPVERNTPFTLNDDPELSDPVLYRQRFVDQTIFLDDQVLILVDRILEQAGDPVIILQGDHGIPTSGVWVSAILNAIRLPGGEDALYPSMSPVNTFRIVFNRLFNAGLPLTPDRSCHFNRSDPASCDIIPDPAPTCQH